MNRTMYFVLLLLSTYAFTFAQTIYAWDDDSLICAGLATSIGYFGIELDDGTCITYGGASGGGGGTGHTNFFVDADIYSTDPFLPTYHPEVTFIYPLGSEYSPSDNAIFTDWNPADSIWFTQILLPYSHDDAGAVKIAYKIANNDCISHSVGILSLIDFEIGGTVFYLPDEDIIIDNSLVMSGDEVPSRLEMYQYSPYDSTHEDQVKATLFMDGIDDVKPDWLAVGNQRSFTEIAWDLDDITTEEIYDGAVIIVWDSIALAAGAETLLTVTMGTMEFAKISQSSMEPQNVSICAFPNPFNSSVRISAPSNVTIEIFDLRGRNVGAGCIPPAMDGNNRRTDGMHDAPMHTFIWQPSESITSGIYLVRATAGEGTITKRIVYLR